MTTSEPTTGEIVRALRCVAEATECKDCRYKYPVGNVILCDHEQMNGNAADRLESQEEEKKISRYLIEMQSNVITELTARAESAERGLDDVEKSLARRIMKHLGDNEFDSTFVCEICEYNLTNSPKCLSCGSDYHCGENFELKHTLRG